MTRYQFLEKELRQIYGGYIPDDSEITFLLANTWLSEGVGLAAKQCYKEAIQIDGVGYVNNSFYTTFKGLSVTKDEYLSWKVTLPQIPVGIGKNEGIASLKFKSADGKISYDCIPLSMNERGFYQNQRRIPNKLLYYSEGINLYALTAVNLSSCTASVTLISGGDSTDLDSVFNVPDDYIPVITEYIKQQLGFEKAQPKDQSIDGSDNR